MNKDEIIEAMKAKFTGVDASVLGRIANKIAKTATTSEQVKTAVEGLTLQQLIDSYADSRATEASQTAVKNYETQHKLKDGKPVEQPNTTGGGQPTATENQPAGGASTDPALAELLQLVKKQTERLDRMESERTTTSRKQQLTSITEKLPENLRKPYERLTLDGYTDEEFTTLLGEITTEVEGIVTSNNARGGAFGKPTSPIGGNGSGANTATKEEATAVLDKMSF